MTVKQPTQIEVRGGNVNNLKNINVDIPLNQFVAISGPQDRVKVHWRWAFYTRRARDVI